MKKNISKFIVLLLSASILVGCGKGESNSTEVHKSEKVTKGSQVGEEKKVDREGLISQIKSKYAAAEKVQYTEPMYNLPKDQTFVYENIPDDLWNKDFYSLVEVYYDAELTQPVRIEIEEDYDNKKITVKPEMTFNYEGEDGSVHVSDGTWGTRSKFYLVQKYDFVANKEYDKPQVTVFTIKQELDTPTLTESVSENGYYMLEWNSVKGADFYEVYYYDPDLDYAELEFTTESTTCLSKDFKSTKEYEEKFREKYKDTEIDVTQTSLINEKIELGTGYFVVGKSNEGKKTGMSNTCMVDEIANRIPYCNQLGQNYEFEGDTALVLPAYLYVEMIDGSSAKMVIEYHGAEVNLYEDGLITVDVTIRNLPISPRKLYFTGMEYDAFLEDAEKLTEREDRIIFNATKNNAEMDIPYVPGSDVENETDDVVDEQTTEAVTHEQTTEDANNEPALGPEADELSGTIYANSSMGEWIALNMLNHEEKIPLSQFPEASATETLSHIVSEAYNQNPLIDIVTSLNYDYKSNALLVKYVHTKVESEKIQNESLKKAKEIANDVTKPEMSDFEKELAINDYLCENCTYNEEILELVNEEGNVVGNATEKFPNSFLPYGILVEKVGVCESYSEAFLLIAKSCGLDAVIETGRLAGVAHEWNRVKIDGNWCILDVTNNDNEYYPNAFFNLTEENSKDLLVPDGDVIVPEKYKDYLASDDEYEYYRQIDRFAQNDEDAIRMFSEELSDKKRASIRIEGNYTEETFRELLVNVLREAGFNTGQGNIYAGVMTVEGE